MTQNGTFTTTPMPILQIVTVYGGCNKLKSWLPIDRTAYENTNK
jgi:hypothetical protein